MLQNAKSYSGDDTCTYNSSFSSQITFEIDLYHISSHVTKCKIIQRGRHLYLEFFFQLSNSFGTQFTSYLKSCYKIQNLKSLNVVPTLSLAIFQKYFGLQFTWWWMVISDLQFGVLGFGKVIHKLLIHMIFEFKFHIRILLSLRWTC